jgi:arylsulfatase A-like enzyme
MIMKALRLKSLAILALTSIWLSATAQAQSTKPNIIVMLLDDMGYSDLSCYGSEIQTPNIDALAANGVRYQNFYNMSRCCPTRASLLSGLYPHKAGVGHMGTDNGAAYPGYRGQFLSNSVTIAEVLGSNGYRTMMTGKWHLEPKPWDEGFDRVLVAQPAGFYFSSDSDVSLGFKGISTTTGNVVVESPLQPGKQGLPDTWYTTNLFGNFARRFMTEAVNNNKPFFLYFTPNAPHTPLRATQSLINAQKGKYAKGWDVLRQERLNRQIALGIQASGTKLPPRPSQVKAWTKLTAAEKTTFETQMEIYAACMVGADAQVGEIVQFLKDKNQYDNTIILFLSDNGATGEYDANGKVTFPAGSYAGGPNAGVTPGAGWGMLSNTPFGRYKHFAHEGGIATSLIVSGPNAYVPADRKGKFATINSHVIDIMPTCLDYANVTYPTTFKGSSITPMAGISLVNSIKGGANSNSRPDGAKKPIFFEHEGNAGVREGPWKLVKQNSKAWELYDLGSDPTELNNLASDPAQQTRKQQLINAWNAWATANNVVAWPGGAPSFTGKPQFDSVTDN